MRLARGRRRCEAISPLYQVSKEIASRSTEMGDSAYLVKRRWTKAFWASSA